MPLMDPAYAVPFPIFALVMVITCTLVGVAAYTISGRGVRYEIKTQAELERQENADIRSSRLKIAAQHFEELEVSPGDVLIIRDRVLVACNGSWNAEDKACYVTDGTTTAIWNPDWFTPEQESMKTIIVRGHISQHSPLLKKFARQLTGSGSGPVRKLPVAGWPQKQP